MKRTFAVSSLAIIVLLLSACSIMAGSSGGAEDSASTDKSIEPLRFTIVSPGMNDSYWSVIKAGVEAADKEFGVNTRFTGPSEIDPEEQTADIERAIAAKVDGIVTSGYDSKEFKDAVNEANDAGIPLVLIDSDIPDSKRECYIGSSNATAGYRAGMAMIEATGGRAVIGIITGTKDGSNLMERISGFKDAIKGYSGMTVVAVDFSDADLVKAMAKTRSMLEATPYITALYGVSGPDILGAAKVVEDKGLAGKITLVGFDDSPETTGYVENGIINAAVIQNPYMMGYLGVKALKDIKDGKKVEGTIDTGVIVLTKDNVDTLTKGNADTFR